ncbi:MAG TPA: GNAT family N-acetyltransferase [Acidimicrobiia bacterium]|nr:GNAT family N-acetyltransferase [Acidimicrobiia bacterium]
MDLELRPFEESELDAVVRVGAMAFSQPPLPPDTPLGFASSELDRSRVAVADGEIVASGRNYSFELTLPGGVIVPAAGVSWISVAPTFRRRGALRKMMAALDADAIEHGEAISILTASEAGIYERFGYGIATWRMNFSVARAHAALATAPLDQGRVRYVDRDDALQRFPLVYARACTQRAGMVSRPEPWWEESFAQFLPADKASFFVVHEDRDGVDDGFLAYEVSGDFEHGTHHTTLHVVDLITTTPSARAALWDFACSVDLIETISGARFPIDEPLRFLLADSRKLRIHALFDHLWLKILDVERALEARRYTTSDTLVLAVRHDDRTTRVELDGGPEGATCRATTADADLELGIATLGSIYLGGTRAELHAAAGRIVEHTPGAVARVDAMLASYPAPASPTWF